LKIRPRLEITIPGLNGKIPEIIKKIDGIESIDIKNDVLFITCDSVARINIISEIKDKGFDVKDIKTIEPSLEEAFMKLIFKDDEVK